MNRQELRIGNWLVFSSKPGKSINQRYVRVEELRSKYLQVADLGLSLTIYYSDENLSSALITPAILERCGFDYAVHPGVTRISDQIDNDDEKGDTHNWTLRVGKSGFVQDLPRFEIVKFGDGDYLWAHQWLRVKLTTLHQLMNLYFSLTGQELNYKP